MVRSTDFFLRDCQLGKKQRMSGHVCLHFLVVTVNENDFFSSLLGTLAGLIVKLTYDRSTGLKPNLIAHMYRNS